MSRRSLLAIKNSNLSLMKILIKQGPAVHECPIEIQGITADQADSRVVPSGPEHAKN